jgi:hypothetical protein
LKKWFSVKMTGSGPVNEGNEDAWTAVESMLAEEKRKAMKETEIEKKRKEKNESGKRTPKKGKR